MILLIKSVSQINNWDDLLILLPREMVKERQEDGPGLQFSSLSALREQAEPDSSLRV